MKTGTETLSQNKKTNQQRNLLNSNLGRASAEVLKDQCRGEEIENEVIELVGGHIRSNYMLNHFKVFLKIYLLPLYVCVHEFMCTAYVQKPMETT